MQPHRLLFGFLLALAAALAVASSASAIVADSLIYTTRSGVYNTDTSLKLRTPGGTVTTLANLGANSGASSPAVSPDGSQIVLTQPCDGGVNYYDCLVLMNIDGSGAAPITHPVDGNSWSDWAPSWSPDGEWIYFDRYQNSKITIHRVAADGLSSNQVSPNNSLWYDNPQVSPDGTKIAFQRYDWTYGYGIYTMDIDGTNEAFVPNQPYMWGYQSQDPIWAPDSNQLYFSSGRYGDRGIYSINTSGSSNLTQITPSYVYSAVNPVLSPDGTMIAYHGGVSDIYEISTSGGTPVNITNTPGVIHEWPSYVPADFPATQPSNGTVGIEEPAVSDDYLERQIEIKLSNTSVEKWQYGWSTSDSTPPSSPYQESTDVGGSIGTLNYGDTDPNENWYLWVRSVATGGTPNSWGTPLKVRTPKQPVWVGVGDSYSSGHHQDVDEPGMVTQHVTENDPAFSWVGRAVQEFNGGIPSQWRIKMSLAAKSGAKAVDFGNSAFTPGTNNWASLGTQAAQVASALYGRRDSWNVVSVDGGANDADFSSTLAQFYFGDPLAVPPWGVTTLTPATHCPDTDSVYGNAVANRSDIRDALQGIADMAEAKSPSTHVLSVGYPYVLNNTNDCHNDDGGWKGEASVISELNSNATSVNGSNVQYLSLASLFGSTPVSSGYIQLTRYYGYPHPSDGPTSGVDEIGDAAAALAYGSGWQQPLVAPRIFLRGHLSIETKDTKKPPEGGSVVIKW